MKKYVLGCLGAAAMASASICVAQTAPTAPAAPHAPRAYLAKPEARAEVQQHVQRMFARLDANRDGFITKDEVAAVETQAEAKWQQRSQKRGQDRANAFDRIDSNHDGVISRDEFAAAPRPDHFGMRHAGFHRGFGGRMFETADANKDGRVSLAEAQQLAFQHFDRADLNHDGTLTPDERRQAHQLLRSQRHPS
jgi:Ca2+-binding EF-hand superfamily protein